jgi:hypothetical protein
MTISAKLRRPWGLGAIGGVILLASATSLSGAQASGASATPSATAPAGAVSLPNPGSSRQLASDWCITQLNCWAVGSFVSTNTGAILNEALHWNGKKWSMVSTPDPGGIGSGATNALTGVTCISASNCWAVGLSNMPGAGTLNEVMQWNGVNWTVIPTPDPAGTVLGAVNALTALSCASATSCWAVGTQGSATINGATLANQALQWNGTAWSEAATPSPGGTATGDVNGFGGITCTSATNCWAVGNYSQAGATLNEAAQWNGTAWTEVTFPNPAGTAPGDVSVLGHVTCLSATNCWAVGGAGVFTTTLTLVNHAFHWNGTNWHTFATPNPDGTVKGAINKLSGVSCTAASNCFAVGEYGSISSNNRGAVANEVLRWTGTRWLVVSSPDPAGIGNGDSNLMADISCVSAVHCLAVGSMAKNGLTPQNQITVWNGFSWSKDLVITPSG